MVKIEDAQKNKELMDKFIQENMGLVLMTIRKMNLPPDEEYIQEGCIGLIKAAKRFDPTYDIAFSTYAIPMIQGNIQRYRRDYESVNVTGLNVSRLLKDVFFQSKKLTDSGLSDDEICEKLHITMKKLNEARQAMMPCFSLDMPLPENDKGEEGNSLYDIIPGSSFEEDLIDEISKNEFMQQLNSQLTEMQSKVLYYHLKELTQNAIAEKVGVSQVQVSRHIAKIIEIGKKIAEGGIEVKSRITEKELLSECKEHGTSAFALEKIANKYGVTIGTLKGYYYRWKIPEKLLNMKKETVKEPETAPVKNETSLPQPAVAKKKSFLKVKMWEGRECTYTFRDGKLVISTNESSLQIKDYKALLQEIQELISKNEAV